MSKTPHIAFCWSSGLIEFGAAVPDGAIEVCRGPQATVLREVRTKARESYGGKLLVPGVPESRGQKAKADALGLWLLWCVKSTSPRMTWSVMDMGSRVVIPPMAVEAACQALLADYRARHATGGRQGGRPQ